MALDLHSASRGRFVFTLSDVIELVRLALNTKVKTMNGLKKKTQKLKTKEKAKKIKLNKIRKTRKKNP